MAALTKVRLLLFIVQVHTSIPDSTGERGGRGGL